MPHLRKRHLETLIHKTIRHSPITGILGHRQVGKTTLSQQLIRDYCTLDLPENLALAQNDPMAFLAKHATEALVIDECQLAPPLFPVLKEWVRRSPRPGQFLLTGSVRFSSRKAIKESLTGRIITWELLPMDWAEQHKEPLVDALPRLMQNIQAPLKVNKHYKPSTFHKNLEHGGLPGGFSVRDPAVLAQRFETQINTILERDLKLLQQTSLSYATLSKLIQSLSRQFAEPLNISQIARETRISMPTLRKLIANLESLFLIRLLPCEGDLSKPIVFFEDCGELNHLRGLGEKDPHGFLAFLYHHLRTQFHYRPELRVESFCFKTQRGDFVPLCYRVAKKILGIVPVLDSLSEAHKSAKAFMAVYPEANVLLVESSGSMNQMIDKKIRHICVSYLI